MVGSTPCLAHHSARSRQRPQESRDKNESSDKNGTAVLDKSTAVSGGMLLQTTRQTFTYKRCSLPTPSKISAGRVVRLFLSRYLAPSTTSENGAEKQSVSSHSEHTQNALVMTPILRRKFSRIGRNTVVKSTTL